MVNSKKNVKSKVSIIIPVYNVKKYLPRCFESATNQTYKDLEIIFVDDGSKDSSGSLCDEYETQDSRVKVIHKVNGGLSSARNAGIEASNGDYIFFLDSDDYLSTKCIEKMVNLLNAHNADVVIVKMPYVSENTNNEIEAGSTETIVMNSERAIEESLYQKRYTCCAPAKLFKREVIGDIRFPEGRLSEDLATCHLFLDNAHKIVYSDYCGYFYRQRDNSIMHVFDPKRMDALTWANSIESFCLERYPNIVNAAICRTFNVAVHLALELRPDDDNYKSIHDQIWNEIRRTRPKVLRNKKARGRDRAAALISYTGDKGLKTIWDSKFAVRQKEI